jgi:hypothetical protein
MTGSKLQKLGFQSSAIIKSVSMCGIYEHFAHLLPVGPDRQYTFLQLANPGDEVPDTVAVNESHS